MKYFLLNTFKKELTIVESSATCRHMVTAHTDCFVLYKNDNGDFVNVWYEFGCPIHKLLSKSNPHAYNTLLELL